VDGDDVRMSIYTINESSNNNNNQISFEMHSALEQFNEHRNTLKMTTGSADLDSLIDGIQEGLFYLFYGNNNYAVQDSLVYRFLVNCVLPIKQKHGFESMGVCFNNADYYNSRKTSLSPEKLGVAAKCASIDPKIVFKNLYIHITTIMINSLSIAISIFLTNAKKYKIIIE
jgi:hypothetical protein